MGLGFCLIDKWWKYRGDLIEVFKIHKGYENIDSEVFLPRELC